MKERKLIAIADSSLKDPEDDLLGHVDLADILVNYLREPVDGVRTIGLIGSWGSGKSSIKNLARVQMDDDASVQAIEFNAWRHGGNDVQRAFFRELYLALGGEQDELDEALFSAVESSRDKPDTSWGNLWTSVLLPSLKLLGIWVVLAGVLIALLNWLLPFEEVTPATLVVYVMLAMWPVGLALYKFLLSPKWLAPLLQEKVTVRQGPVSASEQYETMLLEQLEDGCGKSDHLIVFVDDIDRLRSKPAIGAIEAIRTFLDMPQERLEKAPDMTFVISVDEVRLGATLESELSGRDEARDYVTRLFQLRVEIPPPPTRDLRDFAMRLINRDNELFTLLAESDAMQAVLDRLVPDEVGTPREVVRLVNRLIQTVWLAQRREQDDLTKPGVIVPGRVTNNLECLTVAVALSERFPEFTRQLVRRPRYLHATSRYAMDGKGDIPDAFEALIEKSKRLKRYLASLYGLQWPNHELAFFRLAEDAFSRQFGDQANELRKALVSNDLQAARSLLGVPEAASMMTYQNVQLLEDVLRGLRFESALRRENAARTALLMIEQVEIDARSSICQALLPMWNSIRRLRHSIDILSPLYAFEDVSPDLAVKYLVPVITDFVDEEDISTEKNLEDIKDEAATWMPKALTLSVEHTELQPLVARFLRSPRLRANEQSHVYRWQEVLNWFQEAEDSLETFLDEFYLVFAKAATEDEVDDASWEKLCEAYSLDEEAAVQNAELSRFAWSRQLVLMVSKGSRWPVELKNRLVLHANSLAGKDELTKAELESFLTNIEFFDGCEVEDIADLLVLVATSPNLDDSLLNTLIQISRSFPDQRVLENLDVLHPSAVRIAASRLNDERWAAARGEVVSQFISRGSSANNLDFVRALPPESPPLTDGGVTNLANQIESQANNLEWLNERRELIGALLGNGEDTELKGAVFEAIQTAAQGNNEQIVEDLVRLLVGVPASTGNVTNSLQLAAQRTPCPPLVDLIVQMTPDERPDPAADWLIRAWPKSANFDDHSVTAQETVAKLDMEVISSLLQQHPQNGKSKALFEVLCRKSVSSALEVIDSIPNQQLPTYARLVWRASEPAKVLPALEKHDDVSQVTAVMEAWSGTDGDLDALAAVIESHPAVANAAIERVDTAQYRDADRLGRVEFVRSLQNALSDDAQAKKMAVDLDVKSALRGESAE